MKENIGLISIKKKSLRPTLMLTCSIEDLTKLDFRTLKNFDPLANSSWKAIDGPVGIGHKLLKA
jgi:hypothetical protein